LISPALPWRQLPDNRKSLTPEFEAPQGLKTDLTAIDARRKVGFTSVHILPAGRIAGGQGALLTTSGLPLREQLWTARRFRNFNCFIRRDRVTLPR